LLFDHPQYLFQQALMARLERLVSAKENTMMALAAGVRKVAEDPRTSPAEEALGAILQSLDQAVGTARGNDRRKFVASGREITDGAV
jgi:hypothetical protein